MRLFYTLLIAAIFAGVTSLEARPPRVTQTPYGNDYSCGLCHQGGIGGAPLTDFGIDVETTLNGSSVDWELLALLDSDGDGFTNGEEFQDPNGEWSPGEEAPGNPNLVTNPNDPDEFPTSVFENSFNRRTNVISMGVAYPNPMVFSTEFSIDVNNAGDLNVGVYSAQGKLIRNIYEGYAFVGKKEFIWQGDNNFGNKMPAGVYILIANLNGRKVMQKLVLN